jgi:hypothetical protein
VIGRRFRSQNAQLTVCYDIESAAQRNRVRWSLTTEGVIRFLKKRNPEHYVIARGGKALYTGREFLEEHCFDSKCGS